MLLRTRSNAFCHRLERARHELPLRAGERLPLVKPGATFVKKCQVLSSLVKGLLDAVCWNISGLAWGELTNAPSAMCQRLGPAPLSCPKAQRPIVAMTG